MCGISGIFNLKGEPIPNAVERVERMNNLLNHRGPDSQGVYISKDRSLVLGNTRLAIVDPNNKIKQPLETHDGQCVLSFNGEIYNYLELKESLRARGVQFRTNMDTEVFLEGLRLEGEAILNQFDGMWAGAFYNEQTKKLLLSRDVMGERHIFYRIKGDEFVFCSEVKPILVDSQDLFSIDFDAYLTSLQYFAPPPGRSMIKGINRMLPGHNILLERGKQFKQYRYRKLHPEKWFDFYGRNPSWDEVIGKFEEIFHATCKKRASRDVPYICTLSGGLDSTVICLYISDYGETKINTLYGQSTEKPPQKLETDLDEYTASKLTAGRLNTDHRHTFLNSNDAVPVLKRLADNAFDGMFDSGTAAFEMLARVVHQSNMKVMLISEGPDEFLGYPKDLRAYQLDRIYNKNRLQYETLKLMSSSKFSRNMLRQINMNHLVIPPLYSYSPFRFSPIHKSWQSDTMLNLISNKQIWATSNYYGVHDPVYDSIRPKMDFTQLRALSYAAYSLPDMFNLRIDRSYMNTSVEARLPYQAPDIVDFMIAMPARYRFDDGIKNGNITKYMFRKIVERHISPKIAYRSKHGFAAPIWKSPNIFKEMHYDEIVRESTIFKDFPFQKGARDYVLHPDNKDMLWPFYVLARINSQLKTRSYAYEEVPA